jgi:hypothetical protein
MDDEIDKILEDLFERHRNAFDRFTFDHVFRELLRLGFDHEEAKDMILYTCCLSALVLQERVHNGYYLKISENEKLSQDLIDLRNEIFAKKCPPSFRN